MKHQETAEQSPAAPQSPPAVLQKQTSFCLLRVAQHGGKQVDDSILHPAQANIVCPNKHTAQAETMYKGHLLESETYIGGKVEALESGVFRSDLPMRFKCKPEAYQVRRSLRVSHMMHFHGRHMFGV